MKVPRKGFGYSSRDHGYMPQDADIHFHVPFVGQNHGNLCGDASIMMLCRWAGCVSGLETNLRVFQLEQSNEAKFIKAVEAFKKLSREKLRDQAVVLFNQFLLEDSAQSILASSDIRVDSPAYLEVSRKVGECVTVKSMRDAEYGRGFSLNVAKRWQRHTTREQGYVVDHTFYDKLMLAVKRLWFNSAHQAEMISNPRSTPFTGLRDEDIFEGGRYGNLLQFCPEITDQTRNLNDVDLFTALFDAGPIMACVYTGHSVFGQQIEHFIVVTGIKSQTGILLYHDPWRGANMFMPLARFHHIVVRDSCYQLQKHYQILQRRQGNRIF